MPLFINRKGREREGVKGTRTDWLRHRHDLCAVEGQVAERPDDRVHLLHDVEGDGHDTAGVLSYSYTPAKRNTT